MTLRTDARDGSAQSTSDERVVVNPTTVPPVDRPARRAPWATGMDEAAGGTPTASDADIARAPSHLQRCPASMTMAELASMARARARRAVWALRIAFTANTTASPRRE